MFARLRLLEVAGASCGSRVAQLGGEELHHAVDHRRLKPGQIAVARVAHDHVLGVNLGLGERLANFPAQLSGGEQQRVSIARALAKNPKLLLCDEPTGALDYKTGKQILQLLQDTCRKQGITVIIITHNSALAPMADRLIRFRSGRVESETVQQNPVPIETIEW